LIFTVVVTDSMGTMDDHLVNMTVGVLPMTLGSSPPSQVTALVNFTHQFTAAGGVPPYEFDWSGDLPTGVVVQASGLLVGVPHEVGTFNYAVDAEDSHMAETGPVPFTLVVVPPAITSPPPTSPIYTGQDFGHAFTTTPGTIGSRTFSVSAGALPPGLTLGVGGVLSGKPMAPGTYPFTVRATFVSGVTITSDQAVTMVVADPAVAFTSGAPPNGVVGSPYAFTFTAAGDASITFSVSGGGTLPPGLTLATNGALSGTPSAAGTYAFVVAATGAGSAAQRPTTITIAPAPTPTPTPTPSPSTSGPSTPGGLPATGTSALSLATIGLLLVGVGAVVIWLMRRRRTATETLNVE
jgi:LPXTG-motif cell wall-anchored protein